MNNSQIIQELVSLEEIADGLKARAERMRAELLKVSVTEKKQVKRKEGRLSPEQIAIAIAKRRKVRYRQTNK